MSKVHPFRGIGRFLGSISELGFAIIKNQEICEDEKFECVSRKEMIVKGVSQQFQFNYYCGLFIIPFICACRDLNSGCYCVLSLNLGHN